MLGFLRILENNPKWSLIRFSPPIFYKALPLFVINCVRKPQCAFPLLPSEYLGNTPNCFVTCGSMQMPILRLFICCIMQRLWPEFGVHSGSRQWCIGDLGAFLWRGSVPTILMCKLLTYATKICSDITHTLGDYWQANGRKKNLF